MENEFKKEKEEKVVIPEFLNKRVDITTKNLKRINVISGLIEDEIKNAGMEAQKDKISYIVNLSIENFIKSDDIKKKFENI